jgi:hypothetical protein
MKEKDMSGLFGNLTNNGLEETEDRLGGFAPLETDIYTGPIKVAYAGQAASGARSITLIVDLGGKEYRETIYITNKKGENFFLNKDDKTKKVPLPGFTTINDICLVTTGRPLADQEAEDKMVKIYDPDQKKEVPKSVPVITALLGQTVSLGIVRTLENKSVKDSSGEYVPTPETRVVNSIEKVFHTETKMTVNEATNTTEVPAFWDAWLERNKGKQRDRRTIKDGATGVVGRPGAPRASSSPPVSNGSATPRKSLFGAK